LPCYDSNNTAARSTAPADVDAAQALQLGKFLEMKVPELKQFVSERGISVTGKVKLELAKLALAAYEDGHEVKPGNDWTLQNRKRRTVDGKVLPDPHELTAWSSNLGLLPSIDSFDVHMYLKTVCEWSDERFKRRKSDNGWQLHSNGHIQDVKLCSANDCDCVYITAKSVPETRQSAAPYDLWILVGQSGQIYSAECTCVA
jgi:hypothetical protein